MFPRVNIMKLGHVLSIQSVFDGKRAFNFVFIFSLNAIIISTFNENKYKKVHLFIARILYLLEKLIIQLLSITDETC